MKDGNFLYYLKKKEYNKIPWQDVRTSKRGDCCKF